jgi:hypothetical protein
MDFSKAERFGTLIKLTNGTIDIFKPHVCKQQIDETLQRCGFDAKNDYVLVAGNPLATAFAFSWLTLAADDGQEDHGVQVKVLLFNAKEDDYILRTIKL